MCLFRLLLSSRSRYLPQLFLFLFLLSFHQCTSPLVHLLFLLLLHLSVGSGGGVHRGGGCGSGVHVGISVGVSHGGRVPGTFSIVKSCIMSST